MSVVNWTALQGMAPPTDKALLDGCLSEGLADELLHSEALMQPSGPASGKAAIKQRQEASSVLGLEDLLAQLDSTDMAQMPQLLLAIMHVAHNARPLVLAQALASPEGKALWNKLVAVHERSADLTSMTSQIIVSIAWAVGCVCEIVQREQLGQAPDAVAAANHMASNTGLLSLLLSHVVFLASSPEHMFTRRGLCTLTRAFRVLFFFQTKQLPSSSSVVSLCKSADLGGRALQVLEHQPAQHLPHPELPLDAAKGQSAGELYIHLLAAALTYLGFASGIFNAPGGQMVLDGSSSRASGDWLMSHGRLLALRTALDTLTQVLYRNVLLDHVECPETRHIDITLRNLVMMLTLPLCCSKRQQDMVEVVSLSLQLYQMLYRLDFLPLFTRMLHASHPPDTPDDTQLPALYYQTGQLQPYFAMVAGVMCDALPRVGASMSDLGTATPEQTNDMKAFIEQQIPGMIVWSDMLMAAIQQSQQVLSQGRALLLYRPATADLPPPGEVEGVQQVPEAAQADGAMSRRRCACCGARPARLLACKKCSTALYCGRDCQLQHWSAVHKLQCKLMQSSQPAPAS